MDLLIQQIDEKKTLFESFVDSRVVGEVFGEIIRTTGLNTVFLDATGHVIVHYTPDGPRRLEGSLESYLKNTFANLPKVDGPFRVVFLRDQQVRFLVAPMEVPTEAQRTGYILVGPYKPSGDFPVDMEIHDDPYGLMEFFSMSKAVELDQEKQKKLQQGLKSFLRLLNMLYQEKSRNRRNLKRMSGLYQINASILGVLQLDEILTMVMKKAVDLLEAEIGYIYLLDDQKSNLSLLKAHGNGRKAENEPLIPADRGLLGTIISEGHPRLLRKKDLSGLPHALVCSISLGSVILVPIIAREKVIGLMCIAQKEKGELFKSDDLDLMQALVSGTAAAIDNAQLYTEIQKKVREFGALFDLSSTIVSTLDRKEVLTKVLDNAIQLLQAGAGSLMLLDREKKILEIEVAHGLPEKVIRETRIPLGEGISGKVALEGQPRLLKKGIKEAESKSEKAARVIPSALSVPMMFHSKVIGVLNVKEKSDGGNFDPSDMELLKMLANQAAIAIENARLHKSLEDLFVNSIRALANAIEARDPYTRGHSERVTEYSVKIAQTLGMEQDTVKKIRYAALLHDIGKINIKEEILNKPGRLTDEEFRIMNKHPTLGAKIMEPVKEFRDILPIMYHHHERYGSGGYPDSISGEQIPFPARILAVADSFDAMTSDRPYRKALPLEVAIGELKKHAGTQFDPKVVEVFLQVIEEEEEWIFDTMSTGTSDPQQLRRKKE